MDILTTYFENYNKNNSSSNVNYDVLLDNKKKFNNIIVEENTFLGFKYKPLYKRVKEYLDNKYENMGYIKKKNILKILNAKYVIFLSDKFFAKFTKHKVLKYFDKYDILYLNYHKKDEVLEIMNLINIFIKNASENDKNNFMESFSNNKMKKLKINYFLENIIELNTLYKKISFSNEEIFISFDNYIFKKMEYKLRVFCQIAERLGANVINIEYDSKFANNFDASVSASIVSSAEAGGSVKNNTKNNGKINLTFSYSNFYYNLNLNKFYIYEIIKNEEKFFITNDDFNSDIDLKFLIDARCINLIEKYNTNIIINRVNEMERKIFSKVHNYGINMNYSNTKTDYVNIKISIEFLDIYKQPKCIIGNNIYVLREGFRQIVNIINEDINIDKKAITKKKKFFEEKYYRRLFFFLKNHVHSMSKKYFIDEDYKDVSNIKQYFEDILMLNFTEHERDELFYEYFNINNNVVYKDFIDFRNILLFGNDSNKIDKFTFTSFQYHLYRTEMEYLSSYITKYIEQSYDKLLNIYKDNYKITDEINLTIDISNKYTYLYNINNGADHFTLPFNEKGTHINSFVELNKILIDNKQNICGLILKIFNSLLKTNILIDFDIEDKDKDFKININIFNLIIDNFFIQYLDIQLKCININFESILFNIFIMTNVFIKENMYEICMNNTCKNKYIKDIDIMEWVPSKKVGYYIYKLLKKEIVELYDLNVFNEIIELFQNVLVEKKMYKNNNQSINIKYSYFSEIFNMTELFPENHISINYNKYKILFTWDDYIKIKKYLIHLYDRNIGKDDKNKFIDKCIDSKNESVEKCINNKKCDLDDEKNNCLDDEKNNGLDNETNDALDDYKNNDELDIKNINLDVYNSDLDSKDDDK
jgi:hypothetical protein